MGRIWDSCRDQTWSAGCYIGAVIHGVFGVKPEENGIRFAPCVPEELRNAELRDLKIRGQVFSIKIKGYGNKIKKFILDGKECEPFIEWDNNSHKVEFVLE